jgi:type IV pilus assembly protein PilC
VRLELSVFYRQAGTACRAGIPLTQGLRLAASGCRDARLRMAAEDVEQMVKGGCALGPALSAHPLIFRDLEAAIVAAGEEKGRLDESLLRLAEWCEREHADRQRLLLALIYPSGLFVAALFLPHLHVWVTTSFGAYLLVVVRTAVPFLAVLGALAGALTLFRQQAPLAFDRLQLSVPVLGPNLGKLAFARFSGSLATLHAAGVEIRRSASLAVATLGNRYLEARCRALTDTLARGGGLGGGMAATGVFPREIVHAVEVGERTGNLDRALESVARLHREEAERAIRAILILLPIVVYLLVALYIAVVVISAFGSYFRLVGAG